MGNVQPNAHIVRGMASTGNGTSVIITLPVAYDTAQSYVCISEDATDDNEPVTLVQNSGSQFTLSGGNGIKNDILRYICV